MQLPPRDMTVAGIVALDRRIVGRIVAAPRELVAPQHKASALERDVPHGRQPGLAVVGRRRAVKLYSLGVHVHPQQRHVVFPADHGPDPADRRVEDGHGRAVAEAPHQPLGGGRHQLAMLAQEGAIGREEQDRAVERAAIALDDADDEVGTGLASRRAEDFGRRAPARRPQLSQ